MDPNCNTHFDNSPVSQVGPQDPDMDLWEPQFERWLRLADSVLGNLPRVRPIAPRKNQACVEVSGICSRDFDSHKNSLPLLNPKLLNPLLP